jgi:hypothetical protein
VRHEACIVQDHVDPAMRLYGALHEALNLIGLRHIGLHSDVIVQSQFFRERLQAIHAPCSQHQFGALFSKPACCLSPHRGHCSRR